MSCQRGEEDIDWVHLCCRPGLGNGLMGITDSRVRVEKACAETFSLHYLNVGEKIWKIFFRGVYFCITLE